MTEVQRPVGASSSGEVILTAVSIDGQQVLAVPREVAAAELRTASLLAKASTFGEVRQDADAAAVIELHMEEYRQRLLDEADWPEEDDEEVLARLTADTGDYDAPHFFSDDDQLDWQAYAEVRASTAGWLAGSEPALLERYGRYDEGDGPMYEKATWIAAADRDAFERDLLAAGYTVQHLDTLESIYLDPRVDYELRLQAAYNPDLILTGLTGGGDRLLVIPLAQALEEFAVYDEREIEVDDDGDEIEPEENLKPEPRISTHEWFLAAEPDLLERYANEDTDVGFSDCEPVPWLAPADRPEIEAELARRGYEVRQVADLAFHYMYPPATADELIARPVDANDFAAAAAIVQAPRTRGSTDSP